MQATAWTNLAEGEGRAHLCPSWSSYNAFHPDPIPWGLYQLGSDQYPVLNYALAKIYSGLCGPLFIQLCFPGVIVIWNSLILQMHHESSPILSSKSLHFHPFKIKDVHPFHLLEDIFHNLSIDLGFVVTSHKWPLSQLIDVLAASSLGKSDSLYRPKCFYSVFLIGSLALWISTYPLKNLSSWGVACIFQRWWKHVAKFPLMKCEPLRSQAPNTGLVLLLFLFSTCPSSGQGQLGLTTHAQWVPLGSVSHILLCIQVTWDLSTQTVIHLAWSQR